MRFFDLGRLYTDWDEGLRARDCLLSDSVDAIIYSVEHNADSASAVQRGRLRRGVVMAEPLPNDFGNIAAFPFYADVNGCGQVYRYCYLLPGTGDE